MWEDMVTYWAWRGPLMSRPKHPPTSKVVQYAGLIPPKGSVIPMPIACVVCDDGVCKRINEGEIMDRIQQGWAVTFPEKFHELG